MVLELSPQDMAGASGLSARGSMAQLQQPKSPIQPGSEWAKSQAKDEDVALDENVWWRMNLDMMEHVQVPGMLLLLWVPWETDSRSLNKDSPVALMIIVFCK